ncbi:phosphotransferase family protein, partial [Phytoactinopolyspora halotolerans]|uniref:phosphotransferase family protein n=1 Tax=Phytoactinopolyspora halotolerans TaxID=1981512 RepID=UPI001575B8A7
STLGPAAIARSFCVFTNQDHRAVAAPYPAPTRPRSRSTAGVLSRAVVDEIHSIAADNAPLLDQVTSASLLTGDLWTANVLLSADNDEYPEITGVVDLDRAEWGDPLADWVIWMARKKPGTERDSFWSGYGALAEEDPSVRFRLALYAARHQAAVRLENARLADAAGVQDGSQQLAQNAESLRQMAVG